jgi:hypothetical protein
VKTGDCDADGKQLTSTVSSVGNETLGFEAGILQLLKADPKLEDQALAERQQQMEQDRLDRELQRELKLANSREQQERDQAHQRQVELQTEAMVRHAQQSINMENMMAFLLKQMQKNDK